MPRAGLSEHAVVDAALAVVDADGPQALTLGAVATHCGVATPSLYKHVDGLPHLRALVGARILDDLTDRVTQAVVGRSGPDAVAALMTAYRRYVVDAPYRYAMLPQDPSTAEDRAAGERLLSVILAVLDGCGVSGPDAIHLTRTIRAVAHGFATLQAAGGFRMDDDVDVSYDRAVAMLCQAIPS